MGTDVLGSDDELKEPDMTKNRATDWPRHIDLNRTSAGAGASAGAAANVDDSAGTHLLIDCWQASRLDDIAHIEATLREAVEISGATLLHIHLHHFTPNGGVSGVAVLAESHISIHTWPERDYAALDVFMCGDTHQEETVPVFAKAFCTDNIQLSTHQRGARAASTGAPSTDQVKIS